MQISTKAGSEKRMTSVHYSDFWFDRIPSSLFQWGNFYIALHSEIATLLNSSHVGYVTVYLNEAYCYECSDNLEEGFDFHLSFSFDEDSISVSWAAETLWADEFTVNKDLTWSLDDPCGMNRITDLSNEFESWVESEEHWARRAAVLAIAVAEQWLKIPPYGRTRLDLGVRGPWVLDF